MPPIRLRCALGAGGPFCAVPSCLVGFGFFLSLSASEKCSFLRLVDDNPLQLLGDFDGIETIGFWCFRDVQGNEFQYNSVVEAQWDESFDAARGLATTANAMGCFICIFYALALCISCSFKVLHAVAFLAVVTSMFEGFKFWILRSDFFCHHGCELASGSRYTIAAIVIWLLAAFMTCVHAGERKWAEDEDDEIAQCQTNTVSVRPAVVQLGQRAPPPAQREVTEMDQPRVAVLERIVDQADDENTTITSGRSSYPPISPDFTAHGENAVVFPAPTPQASAPPETYLSPFDRSDYDDPVMHHIMADPVTCQDGYTYDREVIEDWFQVQERQPAERAADDPDCCGGATEPIQLRSPMTNMIVSADLVPNRIVEQQIVRLMEMNRFGTEDRRDWEQRRAEAMRARARRQEQEQARLIAERTQRQEQERGALAEQERRERRRHEQEEAATTAAFARAVGRDNNGGERFGGRGDYRMCGRCRCGPIENDGCANLATHNNTATQYDGRTVARRETPNHCPNCDWFDPEWRNWPFWDGVYGPH